MIVLSFFQVSGSPVTNLRDKLIVAVCNNEDQNVTQTSKSNHSFSLMLPNWVADEHWANAKKMSGFVLAFYSEISSIFC
jgi:hypothetical protein